MDGQTGISGRTGQITTDVHPQRLWAQPSISTHQNTKHGAGECLWLRSNIVQETTSLFRVWRV